MNHGANAYYRTNDGTYTVWFRALVQDNGDNILVARYMIIDKKMCVPSVIAFKIDKTPLSIYDLLDNEIFLGSGAVKKQQAKEEIINYLRKINFLKNGVYKEADSTGEKK